MIPNLHDDLGRGLACVLRECHETSSRKLQLRTLSQRRRRSSSARRTCRACVGIKVQLVLQLLGVCVRCCSLSDEEGIPRRSCPSLGLSYGCDNEIARRWYWPSSTPATMEAKLSSRRIMSAACGDIDHSLMETTQDTDQCVLRHRRPGDAHRDPDVRLFESGRVIYSISGDRDDVADPLAVAHDH